MKSRKTTIWSDGSCKGNPGPGGWAAIIRQNAEIREISGRSPNGTTNQRMEVRACLEGLKSLSQPSRVTVVTDSSYVANSINKWIWSWHSRGWKRATGQDLKNVDLWQEVWKQLQMHDVRAWWIKGHAGNDENNSLADELATTALLGSTRELEDG